MANSQQFNGLTVNPDSSAIILTTAGSTNLLLSLGSISRNTGGTVDFTLPGGTQSAINGITTTTPNTTAGILGGYATVGGTNWAIWDSTEHRGLQRLHRRRSWPTAFQQHSERLADRHQTAITSAKSFNTLNLTGTEGVAMSGPGSLALLGGGLLGNTSGRSAVVS